MAPSEYVLLAQGVGSGLCGAAGYGMLTLNPSRASAIRGCFWASAFGFGTLGIVWGIWGADPMQSLAMRLTVAGITGALAAIALTWALWQIRDQLGISQLQPAVSSHGGAGGSGKIFGNSGTIIGGKGGNVGPGAIGRGGDGGGGVIHGDGGTIIGGEGGSVDGTNIWFPPAQSAYIQYLESQGQTPDFGVQYPGAGGATGGWLQRQQVVEKIREEYFKKTGHEAKIRSSKVEDVPLEYINEKLKESGYSWRARIEKKYWYLYYVPSTP
jgi:hypothetical protein